MRLSSFVRILTISISITYLKYYFIKSLIFLNSFYFLSVIENGITKMKKAHPNWKRMLFFVINIVYHVERKCCFHYKSYRPNL